MLNFSRNHFDLFGLPLTFGVDLDDLADRYRSLCQNLHPDRFASAGDREKRLSMQATALVNEAYQTLKDPLARGRYLLSLRSGAPEDPQQTTRDMAFLMEQLELRENLSGIRQQPHPHEAVEALKRRLLVQYHQLVGELAQRLEDDSDPALDEARELIRKLQFVRKCQSEVTELEEQLDEALCAP